MNITDNANPKHNPITTFIGALFLIVGVTMFVFKYLLPVVYEIRQDVPYEWWAALTPTVIGLILIYMTDEYFSRIFNRVDKVAAKKTDTND